MPLKICILIERLNNGGAERSAGLLSKILSELGHSVFFITIFNDIVYPFEGELINIGANKKTYGSIKNKLYRYWQVKKQLKKHRFHLILDFRIKDSLVRELILNVLVFRKENMINMVRSFNLDWYFPNPKKISKFFYKMYLGNNTVSFEIKRHIETTLKLSNVSTIYSPVSIEDIRSKLKKEFNISDTYIIAMGRLEPVKQFDKLLVAYSKSILPSIDIKLYILGNGSQREILKTIINDLKLQNHVKLIPFVENPFNYLKNAKFTVLTSINEGFPRVLIESLACETPVISFNCKSGPSEIIAHRENGLLVKDQDLDGLINALNEMINNYELYSLCKKNSLKSIAHFSMSSIKEDWLEYIEGLELGKLS